MSKNTPMAYIKPNESVFIPGRNGSGKSFLAQKYLSRYPAVFALDSKGDLEWNEIPKNQLNIITSLNDLEYAGKDATCKVVYRPDIEEMKTEYYEEFFRYLYFRQNCITWVDEVMAICPNAYQIPEYYKGILTRGRSRNTAAWSLSQRPAGIPNVIMSESKHFFVFDLNMVADRDRVAKISGCPELLTLPNKEAHSRGLKGDFYFWYYFITWERARLGMMQERG